MFKNITYLPASYYLKKEEKEKEVKKNIEIDLLYEDFLLFAVLAQHALSYERIFIANIAELNADGEVVPCGDPTISCSAHMVNMLEFCSNRDNYRLNVMTDIDNSIFTVELIPVVEVDDLDLAALGFKQDKIVTYSMLHVERANHLFMMGLFLMAASFTEYESKYKWLHKVKRILQGVEDAFVLGEDAHMRDAINHVTNSVKSYKLDKNSINLVFIEQDFFGPDFARNIKELQ